MKKILKSLSDFNFSFLIFSKAHWLLRIPLSIIFIQQGLSKLPINIEDAQSFGLPFFVWFLVAWGELFAGIGLLVGGLIEKSWVADIITRFSGIVIVGIVSGIIIISKPESILDVLLYDNLHVFLYVLGLFFVLRGNRVS